MLEAAEKTVSRSFLCLRFILSQSVMPVELFCCFAGQSALWKECVVVFGIIIIIIIIIEKMPGRQEQNNSFKQNIRTTHSDNPFPEPVFSSFSSEEYMTIEDDIHQATLKYQSSR